jgi:thioesterase domain-containing protein
MNLRHLAHALGEDQPFYGLQHRGVDGRLQPHRTVEDMAQELLADVRKLQPRGPYFFAGYSAGGLVGYEMAQQLTQMGETVGLLVLFDTFNPTLPEWTRAERLQAHLENLRRRGAAYVGNRIVARLERYVTRARHEVGARLAARDPYKYRHDALLAAGIEAERRYQPNIYAGHVLLVRADPRLTAGDGIGYKPHESNGWRSYVPNLEIADVACSHTDVVAESTASLPANVVRRALAQARQRLEERGAAVEVAPPIAAAQATAH